MILRIVFLSIMNINQYFICQTLQLEISNITSSGDIFMKQEVDELREALRVNRTSFPAI